MPATSRAMPRTLSMTGPKVLEKKAPTLRAAAASARGRTLHQVEGLHEKAMRALKKRDQGRASRLRRTRDALFPGGSFQERGLGLLGAAAARRPGWLAWPASPPARRPAWSPR